MGTYDILSLPNTPTDGEQVKLWNCEMETFKPGDSVPPLYQDLCDYGIVLPSGGVAVIRFCRLAGWTPWPMEETPLFDKWGNKWHGNMMNTGMLNSPYFFRSKKYEG